MKFKDFFSLLEYDGLMIFADSENVYQSKIVNLLKLKQTNFKLLSKKNFQQNKNNFFYLNTIIFYLIFSLNRKSKKILFVAQPAYAVIYTILNNFILVPYDCHYGLPKISFLKLFLEKYVLKKIKFIVHRDLRFWKVYKNILIKKKNILIPDHASIDIAGFNKNDNSITAVVLGWVDEKEVQVTETVRKLLKLGVNIEFYITEKCESEIKSFKLEIEENYPTQVNFNKYINQEQTINKISKFHIGICPHSKRNSLILSEYRKYCGSSRIINYIEANLSILISRSALFQKFIARSHNAHIINIFDLENFKNKEELASFLKKNKKNNVIKKKIFQRDFLADYLDKFILL